MTTGLSGTPMPSYRDAFPDEDRWALSYYVLSLSAYKDPLTKQPLAIPETDRAALNNPNLEGRYAGNCLYSGPGLAAKGCGRSAPPHKPPPKENETWRVSRSLDPTPAPC